MQKRNGQTILLKTFMKLSVRETETPLLFVRSPKQAIILIFIPLIFLLFIFPANLSDFFSLCHLFSSYKLKTKSHYTTRTEPRVVHSTKLSPVLRVSYQDGWPKTNTSRGNNFIFFSFPFEAMFKTVELPSLVWCRFFYFSTICSSFHHVRIRVHIYNIVQSYK